MQPPGRPRTFAIALTSARLTVVAAALTLAAPLAAQGPIVLGYRVPGDVSVHVSGTVGLARVVGWAHDSIDVRGTLPKGFSLQAGAKAGVARIALEGPSGERVAAATFEIRVPQGARVWVRSVTGDVELDDLAGAVDVITGTGRVRVAGSPERISAESLDGNVEIAASCARTRVRAGGGTVVVRGVTGELDAATVGGALHVGGTALTASRLESVSGEVSFKGSVAPGGLLEVQTHDGAVDLRLYRAAGAEVDVTTLGGAVTSVVGDSITVRPGKRAWTRTVAGGGARVVVRSYRGDVALRQVERGS